MSEIRSFGAGKTKSEVAVHWHDMDGGDWAWMTSMMVLFWGLVAVAAIALIHRTSVGDSNSQSTPEETLRRRLANGEIDVEEYQHRLEGLRAPADR